MRLTVQDLFAGTESADSDTQATQYVAEKLPIGTKELWSLLWVGDQLLCLSNLIGEMRCSHLELAQASMEAGGAPTWRFLTSLCSSWVDGLIRCMRRICRLWVAALVGGGRKLGWRAPSTRRAAWPSNLARRYRSAGLPALPRR